ncbi:bifunctional DNA-formamidopyrimidine glycosylase/DNA-(apurinic or apyrimidinic site) lyase [Candidatus Saccharibacteria bacterium]|nr:bifunctional DNA-formamidopyrimidine glycosylase/DNA-(apurinic or apyrimidinic site) lyase [Candidatus Saccharibacteria bacterium]NIV03260.1 bifunctional DNA-formamidopyrimidine glycosylase/DNA-(apurinic or apyrimidinic site) lyase [Calditrichia bacterium]NIS37779.1 bifunctional DNA-formamidopyrimidine glycosylase/DNA-(apurinic or apyrimidinic site) lyase [Candidatus Saccharibacteria bacterium]NIV71418.1 bifunctional DNA-formamidopyrimidine glycosylase/DNA-(apurinic or apyrimidinic site) lyas
MPELPEVETIVRQLRRKIKGKKISRVKVLDVKNINLSGKRFEQLVSRKIIKNIRRRAKVLYWELSGDKYLVFHLKLNGRILWVKDKEQPHKETRVVFDLPGSYKIFFDDSRRFAWVRYYDKKELDRFFDKMNFGPEPLERSFTLEVFKERLARRLNAKIKQLLMEPKFVAGIGNIYAQEACFYAGIMPTRRVKTLKDQEIKNLYKSIVFILKEAVRQKGTSSDVYVDLYGKAGDYVEELKVYGREGEKCTKCGSVIKFIKQAGRGTRYCPKCQK